METSRKSLTARVLAVVALIGAVIVLVAIDSGSTGSDSGKSTPTATTKNVVDAACLLDGKPRPAYHVQEGDTLNAIAHKCGVSEEKLKQLNPTKDPNLLQPGQWVKLH
jgi:LysM repeat protein